MIYIILFIGFALVAFFALHPIIRERKRTSLVRRPLPSHWQAVLASYWPLYKRLPPNLRDKLHRHVQLFMAEKSFFGCQGLHVTEQMRLLIAAQASLLIVNKHFGHYDHLKSLLIYPTAFITNHEVRTEDGIHSYDERVLSGEAWDKGKIVIAWDETASGIANPNDGVNVVIHEFAHVLDHENGAANGAPYLEENQNYNTWSKVLSHTFERLQHDIASGVPTPLSDYATTSPAEFFAVTSEVFFENSDNLKTYAPELYEQFRRYYKTDPMRWSPRD